MQFSKLCHSILVNQHICVVFRSAGHISAGEALFQWFMYTSMMSILKTKTQRHTSREKVYSCKITAECMRSVMMLLPAVFERGEWLKKMSNVVFQKYSREIQLYSLVKLLLSLYFNTQGFLKDTTCCTVQSMLLSFLVVPSSDNIKTQLQQTQQMPELTIFLPWLIREGFNSQTRSFLRDTQSPLHSRQKRSGKKELSQQGVATEGKSLSSSGRALVAPHSWLGNMLYAPCSSPHHGAEPMDKPEGLDALLAVWNIEELSPLPK